MISLRRAIRIKFERKPLPGLFPSKIASALGSLKPLIIAPYVRIASRYVKAKSVPSGRVYRASTLALHLRPSRNLPSVRDRRPTSASFAIASPKPAAFVA